MLGGKGAVMTTLDDAAKKKQGRAVRRAAACGGAGPARSGTRSVADRTRRAAQQRVFHLSTMTTSRNRADIASAAEVPTDRSCVSMLVS